MPRKFRKRPELHSCALPGIGVVPEGKILEGDEYAKFCPSLLVEVPESEVVKVAAPSPPPPPPPPPKPAPKPEPKPEPAPEKEPEKASEKKSSSKKKGTKGRGRK